MLTEAECSPCASTVMSCMETCCLIDVPASCHPALLISGVYAELGIENACMMNTFSIPSSSSNCDHGTKVTRRRGGSRRSMSIPLAFARMGAASDAIHASLAVCICSTGGHAHVPARHPLMMSRVQQHLPEAVTEHSPTRGSTLL
jgi:hypothetical protein